MRKKGFIAVLFIAILIVIGLIATGVYMLFNGSSGEPTSSGKSETSFWGSLFTSNDKSDSEKDTGTTEITGPKQAVVSEVSNDLSYEGEDVSIYTNQTMGEEEDIANRQDMGIDITNKSFFDDTDLPFDGVRLLDNYLELYMKLRTDDTLWRVYVDEGSYKSDVDYCYFKITVDGYEEATISCRYDIFNKQYNFESSYFDQ